MIPRRLSVESRKGEQGAWASKKEGKGRGDGGEDEGRRQEVFFSRSLALHRNARRWSHATITCTAVCDCRVTPVPCILVQSERAAKKTPLVSSPHLPPHLPFPSPSFSLAHAPCSPILPPTINILGIITKVSFLFLFIFIFSYLLHKVVNFSTTFILIPGTFFSYYSLLIIIFNLLVY